MLLSEAIDRCQLCDRAALARVTAEVVVVGVPGDLLFPFELQQEMHRELEAAGATASLWTLASEFGHDAFLADQARLAGVLRDAGCFAAGRRPR
jgi:homoserine O-acetyltransferase